MAKTKKYQLNPAWGNKKDGKLVPKMVFIHGEKVKPGSYVDLDDEEASELLGRSRQVKDEKTGKTVAVPMLLEATSGSGK